MKTAKNKAENYLYEAASRYFDEIDEALVKATLPDGRTIMVDDEDYESIEDMQPDDEFAGDDEIAPASRPAAYTGAATKAKARAAAKAIDAANFEASGESDEFNALIPRITDAIQVCTKALLDNGELEKLEDGSWYVAPATLANMQAGIFKSIVAPAIKQAGQPMNNSPIRFAWEKFIGWRGVKQNKLLAFKNKVTAAATAATAATKKADKKKADKKKAAIPESCEFNKLAYKYVNEALKYAYSDRYGVSLAEANKMFIVKDII